MMVRGTGITKVAREVLSHGGHAAKSHGINRCIKLSEQGLTLVTVDPTCRQGSALLSWHNETSRGFDVEAAADEVRRVIENHKDQVAKSTAEHPRPLVTFWAPHEIIQAFRGSKKLRPGEVWAAAIVDNKTTRAPVSYFTD